MSWETENFLNSLSPYFKILEKVNADYQELIKENGNREMPDNAEQLYTLITNIVRLLPIKVPNRKSCLAAYKEMVLDDDGILLLANNIDFLRTEMEKIIEDEKSKYVLSRAVLIRNKFTHAPHTVHCCFSVGGPRSFSAGVYYEDTLLSISTIWLENIIYDLNILFDRIRDLYVTLVESDCPQHKKHPYYQLVSNYLFSEYNKNYNRMPWGWIETEADHDEYEKMMDVVLENYRKKEEK